MAAFVNYFEIGTPHPDSSAKFFTGLFDWHIDPPTDRSYAMVDGGRGGLWDTTTIDGGDWLIPYVDVEDVQATVDRAVELGGTVVVPLVNNGAIEFAHLLDPRGNRFGVWRSLR